MCWTQKIEWFLFDRVEEAENFLLSLEEAGIRGAEVFSAKIKLINGT